jgi:hypothetical protein
VEQVKAVIPTAQHPAFWKQARGVAICKSGMDDDRKLKVNRSISGLSCMWYVVEKVVAEQRPKHGER